MPWEVRRNGGRLPSEMSKNKRIAPNGRYAYFICPNPDKPVWGRHSAACIQTTCDGWMAGGKNAVSTKKWS